MIMILILKCYIQKYFVSRIILIHMIVMFATIYQFKIDDFKLSYIVNNKTEINRFHLLGPI